MTYAELQKHLSDLSEEQLQMDITVELGQEDECFPAEFRIAGPENDMLDENHPVIYVP